MSCNRLRLVSLLYQSCDHRDLHSFPTRRSSDLILYESGVVPEPFDYHDDRRVIEFGIGLTDLVKRPTKGVEELKREDFAEGRIVLSQKLEEFTPQIGRASCRERDDIEAVGLAVNEHRK